MDKKFLIVVAAIIALTNTVIYLTGVPAGTSGDCSLQIASPSRGGVVEITETASGTASMPHGAHLWVLAKLRADSRWWPQGEAAVAGDAWKLQVQFGIPRQTGQEFYLAAVAVPEKAHARLAEWVSRKAEERRRPINLPELAAGCPLDMIAVRRSK